MIQVKRHIHSFQWNLTMNEALMWLTFPSIGFKYDRKAEMNMLRSILHCSIRFTIPESTCFEKHSRRIDARFHELTGKFLLSFSVCWYIYHAKIAKIHKFLQITTSASLQETTTKAAAQLAIHNFLPLPVGAFTLEYQPSGSEFHLRHLQFLFFLTANFHWVIKYLYTGVARRKQPSERAKIRFNFFFCVQQENIRDIVSCRLTDQDEGNVRQNPCRKGLWQGSGECQKQIFTLSLSFFRKMRILHENSTLRRELKNSLSIFYFQREKIFYANLIPLVLAAALFTPVTKMFTIVDRPRPKDRKTPSDILERHERPFPSTNSNMIDFPARKIRINDVRKASCSRTIYHPQLFSLFPHPSPTLDLVSLSISRKTCQRGSNESRIFDIDIIWLLTLLTLLECWSRNGGKRKWK